MQCCEQLNPHHCDGSTGSVCSTSVFFIQQKKHPKNRGGIIIIIMICSVPVLCISSCILFIPRSVGMDCMSVFYAGTTMTCCVL